MNAARDLPVCSAVPQPTEPPRAPFTSKVLSKFMLNYAYSWSRKPEGVPVEILM